ncbi:MAG: biopolymer transporter ExbD [Planctomycetales bacterium]
MKLPASTAESDGPNLTPVIDVVFLLLIFFLVATTYDREEREADINPPEVAAAEPLAGTQDLVINVTRDGTYRVVQKDYDEAGLAGLLHAVHEKNPHKRALIYADGDSALKFTMRVVGLCKKAQMDYTVSALQRQDVAAN